MLKNKKLSNKMYDIRLKGSELNIKKYKKKIIKILR